MPHSVSRRASIAAFACLLLGGGALTAGALAATGKHKHSKLKKAAVTTTSTTSTSTTTTPRGPNEDATHEAGESAAVEAQENATGHGGGGGARGDGPFRPNEDAAHEANESAAREAQEDAGQRPTQP
jgi:hypothetical protein